VVRSIAAPVLFSQVFSTRAAGDADHDASNLDRRLGRAGGHHGAGFRYAGLVSNEGVNVSLLFGAISFIVGVFAAWCGSSVLKRRPGVPSQLEVPQ